VRRFLAAACLIAGFSTASALHAAPDTARKLIGQSCAACHGVDGNGTAPPNPLYPKLAAKQAAYLAKQLKDFQSGTRASEIMAPWVAALGPDEITVIAEWYAAQTSRREPVRRPELLELGRRVYLDGNVETGLPACAGCHREDASGTNRFPHLAGQHAQYTYRELQRFASGERDNDRGLVMQSVAIRMTDEEMQAVAEYLMSLD
jgi:cytochrome c553